MMHVERRYRETLAASDVKDSAALDSRHSEHVTIAYHPDLSAQPLSEGFLGGSWNMPLGTCTRVPISAGGTVKKAPLGTSSRSGTKVAKTASPARGRRGKAESEVPARSMEVLLAFLDS